MATVEIVGTFTSSKCLLLTELILVKMFIPFINFLEHKSDTINSYWLAMIFQKTLKSFCVTTLLVKKEGYYNISFLIVIKWSSIFIKWELTIMRSQDLAKANTIIITYDSATTVLSTLIQNIAKIVSLLWILNHGWAPIWWFTFGCVPTILVNFYLKLKVLFKQVTISMIKMAIIIFEHHHDHPTPFNQYRISHGAPPRRLHKNCA